MSYDQRFAITQFAVVPPALTLPQADTLDWLEIAHAKAAVLADGERDYDATREQMRRHLQRFGCKPSQIGTRGFDTFDPKDHDFGGDGLYALGQNATTGKVVGPHSTPLGQRMQLYLERSIKALQRFYPASGSPGQATDAPDHLVHVTCTGYISPSAAQRLVNERGWHTRTGVTHAYHMGCYAAFPAVRVAEGLARTMTAKGNAAPRVDIVHTELCTLHLNPAASDPGQMVIHTLFADGYIKYSLMPAAKAKRGFEVLAVMEEIVADSVDDMSWRPEHWGIGMTLSRDVPRKIAGSIRGFLQRLATSAGCDLGQLLKYAQFAIHPGGPRIIDSVQEILELRDDQTHQSKAILFNHGNMSSATLPHVWQAMYDEDLKPATKIVSLAFGPGLTIFGGIFSVI